MLVCVSSSADSEIRIRVQIVYLEGDHRMHDSSVEEREKRKPLLARRTDPLNSGMAEHSGTLEFQQQDGGEEWELGQIRGWSLPE